MKDYKEFPSFFISLLEEGIVHVEMKDVKVMAVKDTIQIYDEIERIGKGEKMCILTTFNGFISSQDKEVSQYATTERAGKLVLATAYVFDSFALRIAIKFFMNFHKQVVPRKVFDNKKQGLSWLRKMREEILVPVER